MNISNQTARGWMVVTGFVFLPMIGLFIWWLSAILWLPDLISPDATRVIGRCTLSNSEAVELTQRWVGDGYLTGVRHHRTDGSSVFVVGDGDAARTFRCRTFVRTNDGFVVFQFTGKEWHYDPRGGTLLRAH